MEGTPFVSKHNRKPHPQFELFDHFDPTHHSKTDIRHQAVIDLGTATGTLIKAPCPLCEATASFATSKRLHRSFVSCPSCGHYKTGAINNLITKQKE